MHYIQMKYFEKLCMHAVILMHSCNDICEETESRMMIHIYVDSIKTCSITLLKIKISANFIYINCVSESSIS
jgi:hypothetical protein